jgi:hypothetical protein
MGLGGRGAGASTGGGAGSGGGSTRSVSGGSGFEKQKHPDDPTHIASNITNSATCPAAMYLRIAISFSRWATNCIF